MADTTSITPSDQGDKPRVSLATAKPQGPSRQQQLNKLYALPSPLRTFSLPTFVPHNPLSLFHILFVWISQTIKPQPAHFEPLYHGWFSSETRSVHVTDARSIRGLWEQGFYGKGSLSRSEPQWLVKEEKERKRRGEKESKKNLTAEEITRKRRAERQQTKWERARKEREAIDQKLLEESQAMLREVNGSINASLAAIDPLINEIDEEMPEVHQKVTSRPHFLAPVGPLELLALPNSDLDLESVLCFSDDFDKKFVERFYPPPIGPIQLLALPNRIQHYHPIDFSPETLKDATIAKLEQPPNGHAGALLPPTATSNLKNVVIASGIHGLGIAKHETLEDAEIVGGSDTNDDAVDESVRSTRSEDTVETNGTPPNGSPMGNGGPPTPKIKRQKSVRFSPTVEKNTFIQSEPPSPERAALGTTTTEEEPLIIRDQEHLQLTLEEAFFLSYALGALNILDPETKQSIPNQDLFFLFRKISYFPPISNPSLSPDDPFMVNYVVFHHFRSLGWVIRSGIKFSVDYMLYVRGPVFTHAEFAVLILPSYSDPYWRSNPFLQNYVKSKETRTWAWMNCINRVIVQVKKTLILCYVDIPKPLDPEVEQSLGLDSVLARYRVREIVMRRFSANRQRD